MEFGGDLAGADDEVGVLGGHARHPSRLSHDEAGLSQALQRLAHRRPGHLQPSAELLITQLLPGSELTADDRVADRPIDVVPQQGAVLHRGIQGDRHAVSFLWANWSSGDLT